MRRIQTAGPLVTLLLCLSLSTAFGQGLDELAAIAVKPAASMKDLSSLLPELSARMPDAQAYLARLEASLSAYEPEDALTKGRASRVACAALGLRSSALYLLFPTERYAFRTLVMEGVFKSASSPGERMAGMDLLDFIGSLEALAERYR